MILEKRFALGIGGGDDRDETAGTKCELANDRSGC
jgi:hypothetical protein